MEEEIFENKIENEDTLDLDEMELDGLIKKTFSFIYFFTTKEISLLDLSSSFESVSKNNFISLIFI